MGRGRGGRGIEKKITQISCFTVKDASVHISTLSFLPGKATGSKFPSELMIPPDHVRLTSGIANKAVLSGTTAARNICC